MHFEIIEEHIVYKLSIEKERISAIHPSLKTDYIKNAVKKTLDKVGDNPALCLSGGLDSQFMVKCFAMAGYNFRPVIFDFDGLNIIDVEDAKLFCKDSFIEPNIISVDPIRFYRRHCVEFGTTHGIRSPQFAFHAWNCKLLEKLGYTGAVFGGNSLAIVDNKWLFQNTAAQSLDLPSYSVTSGWPVIGNFISYDCELSLSVTASIRSVSTISSVQERHQEKILGYRRYGAPVIAPHQKLTGFEKVKEKINQEENLDGAFERLFRVPLYSKTKNYDSITITTGLEDELRSLYSRFQPSVSKTFRIR